MWDRKQIKANAKGIFTRHYWHAVLAGLIMIVVEGAAASAGSNSSLKAALSSVPVVGGAVSHFGVLEAVGVSAVVLSLAGLAMTICVWNPLAVGVNRFFINCGDRDDENLGAFGTGFSGNFGNACAVMFLRDLFTFLWSLLFIIPGIVKSYEYMMVPYLLAENPDISHDAAFEQSREMMDGNKWRAFVLDLSFLGWHILGLLTFGILEIFWVSPYYCQTHAELYRTLRDGLNPYKHRADNPYTWA